MSYTKNVWRRLPKVTGQASLRLWIIYIQPEIVVKLNFLKF
jgi:hypothetical protein